MRILAGIVPLLVIIWQYVAETTDIIKPSMCIDKVANCLKFMFGSMGKCFAHLSSFYLILKFDRLFVAIQQLVISTWQLLTSYTEFITGYMSTAMLYDHPYMVVAGSLTLVGLIVLGLVRFFRPNWIRYLA